MKNLFIASPVVVASALLATGCATNKPADTASHTSTNHIHMASVKPERAVATVNGRAIAKSALEMPKQQGQVLPPELQDKLLDEVISRELIRQDLLQQDLTNDVDLNERLDNVLRMAYSQVSAEHHMKDIAVTDEELRKAYEAKRAEAVADLSYKAKHILLDNEADAKAAIAKLQKGENFDKLAKKLSKDPGSKDKGGDLDWISPEDVVPEFGNALKAMKKGDVTAEPVKSQFGWHVIMLEDTKTQEFPAFEAVREQVAAMVRSDKFQKYVDGLKAKAQIVKTGAPAAATPAAAPAAPAK